MRILLAHNSSYFPGQGGGDISNRLLMEALAQRGRQVLVFTRTESFGESEGAALLRQLAQREVPASIDGALVHYSLGGVEVHAAALPQNLRESFRNEIAKFDPDVILTSTDDPALLLFEVAIAAPRARVVRLVRATIAAPFGPDSSGPNPQRTELLRQADGMVGVSEYVARYIRQWSGIDAVHVPISLLPTTEPPVVGSFRNRFISMVNPSAVKGISIFLELADRLPHMEFAAVPSWGTSASDRSALAARPNITLLPRYDDIAELLRETRILLVPSLWAEARSRVVVEAMLHGVPVIASDAGGISEAKLGVPYLIPVRTIERYQPAVDSNMVPVAEVPRQDIQPWLSALEPLLHDERHYLDIAAQSREKSLAYLHTLSVEPFDNYLSEIARRPKKRDARRTMTPALSPAKQRLLALRVRKQNEASWFPLCSRDEKSQRLFCFPHAGGGTLSFRAWAERMHGIAAVCPARLPGREGRPPQPEIASLAMLVTAIANSITPHLDRPFSFYGHSMGAIVAFEIARELRRRRLPVPGKIFVSAARAPVFRLNYHRPPPPTEAEFVAELRRLEGLPLDVLESRELLELALPAIRWDAGLFRNYIYEKESRLDIPLWVFGGEGDPNVQLEHLEPWCEETTADCIVRMFPGGHFFPFDSPAFIDALIDGLLGAGRLQAPHS